MESRTHIIAVRIVGDEIVSASHVINRGDTVIWRFNQNVNDENGRLEVRPKRDPDNTNPPSLFEGVLSPVVGPSDQIRGIISSQDHGNNSIEYDIFRGEKRLEWADGRNGGCLKPIEPPIRP